MCAGRKGLLALFMTVRIFIAIMNYCLKSTAKEMKKGMSVKSRAMILRYTIPGGGQLQTAGDYRDRWADGGRDEESNEVREIKELMSIDI